MKVLTIVIVSLVCLVVTPALSEGVVDDISITIDQTTFRIVPISLGKAKVTGRIVDARYLTRHTWTENASRRVPVYQAGSGSRDSRQNPQGRFERTVAYYKTEYYKETKYGKSYWKEYHPDRLKIDMPFSKKAVFVDVLSDGQFSGTIELEDNRYFEKRKDMYLKDGYSWWWEDVKISFSPSNPEREGRYVEAKDADKAWKIYYVNVSSKVVDNLTGCLSHIKLEFVEKNSRVPVSTTATVTVLQSPSFGEIKSNCEAKYDPYVVKKAVKSYRDTLRKNKVYSVLKKGDVFSEDNVNGMDLWVHKGATLKVESRSRDFYYFKSIIRPESREKRYSVLLVETGDKTRQDDEGHGGEIVSND